MHTKKLTTDWINAFFEYGIDKTNRRVFLFDDIDNFPIGIVIKALYLMDSSNKNPIYLYVGSYGGCEYDMFALYDTIQILKSPVYTVATGKCMSAAPLLVCCGEKGHRYATENTFFMVHQGYDEVKQKKFDEIKTDLDHWKELEDTWYRLMEKHTNKSVSFWKLQCQKIGDRYFNVAQAKEWGLIDNILG